MQTLCGLDALWVEEAFSLVALQPIAGLGAGYLGAIDLRGTLLPVVDLADCLGLARSPYTLSEAIIVLRSSTGATVGLIVNSAVDLRSVALGDDPSPLLSELSDQAREIVHDVVLLDNRPIALIDADHLLAKLQHPDHNSHTSIATSVTSTASASIDRWSAISVADLALLKARAAELAQANRTVDTTGGQAWIVVEIGGECFGIDAATVRELAELSAIVPLPCCPSHILGNANLRGEIVTAIDISPWLGQERRPPKDRALVVIVQVEDLTVGLAIDRAIETQWVNPHRLAPVPFSTRDPEQLAPVNSYAAHGSPGDMPASNHSGAYIRGINVQNGYAVSWLDVTTLLTDGSLTVDESI